MKYTKKLWLLSVFAAFTLVCRVSFGNIPGNYPNEAAIYDVYATAYYCVYDSELAGIQTVTMTISNKACTLKGAFLFGGHGVAMQGTGRTSAGGDYIKYIGSGGNFVRLTGPNAGRNLENRLIIEPRELRERYAKLGITDFTGFGNLALSNPESAAYSIVSSIAGSSEQSLTAWLSIAVDSSLIPAGQAGIIVFKNGETSPSGLAYFNFIAQDSGQHVKGKHIDIYLGEGQSVIDEWNRTGGNRYVDIYLQ